MLLYAITDRTMLDVGVGAGADHGDERPRQKRLAELARGWAAGGVDFIQVREKDLGAEALCSLTRAIVEAVRTVPGGSTRVLLNAGTDELRAACAECGQDGFHLPGGLRLDRGARPGGLLSIACHSLDEVRVAREEGADLAIFAPVFEKPLGAQAGSGALPGAGLDALAEACRRADRMPVIALGGVTASNAAECLRAGAAGVAGIRLFFHPRWTTLR